MKRSESLASKISSAERGINPRTTWWPRHVFAVAKYFAVSAQQKPGILSARESALEQAGEWDGWMPAPARKGLMETHAALELDLVDATRKGDTAEVDRVGTLLIENAVQQGGILGLTVEAFPEDRFRRLLEEHIALFAGHMRSTIEGRGQKAAHKHAQGNVLSLADLTVEWF